MTTPAQKPPEPAAHVDCDDVIDPERTTDEQLKDFIQITRADGRAYIIHAEDYKRLQEDGLVGTIRLRSIDGFWLDVVRTSDGTVYFPNALHNNRGETRPAPYYVPADKGA